MSKDLPYFRFYVSEWLNDDISLEDYKVQGVFASVCAYYWFQDCAIKRKKLEKKFSDAKDEIQELIDLGIIKENGNGYVKINFLDKQFDMLSEKRKKRVKAGRLGGSKNSKHPEEARVKGEQLYFILCYNESEAFLKVGVTSSSISQRFSFNMPYDYIVLQQIFKNTTALEKKIDRKFNNKYTPKKKFNGYTECYNVDLLNPIKDFIEKETSNPFTIDKQCFTIIEDCKNYSSSYKEKDKEKEKDKDKEYTPDLEDVITYFTDNGYTKESAKKFYKYYEASIEGTKKKYWRDSKGNMVKSWKQKAQAVWFKEEHRQNGQTNFNPKIV